MLDVLWKSEILQITIESTVQVPKVQNLIHRTLQMLVLLNPCTRLYFTIMLYIAIYVMQLNWRHGSYKSLSWGSKIFNDRYSESIDAGALL